MKNMEKIIFSVKYFCLQNLLKVTIGSNNAIKSPSKSDSQQTSKLLDMFLTLEAKMDKMDASFQLLCTEVAEMRGEISKIRSAEISNKGT